jgi:trigger factor
MKIDTENLPDSITRIRVELEPEEVSRYFDDSVLQFARTAQIPGFRKGKVPGHILEMKLSKSLQAEVLEKICKNSYTKACDEKELHPVSEPDIDTGEELPCRNKPYGFTFTVETKPEVSIDGYKEMVLEREKVEITDELVEAALQYKREKRAEFLSVTGRSAMKGDWILLDGECLLDGKMIQDLPDYRVEMGSGNIPREIDEALAGCTAGDEKEVNLTGEKGKQITYKLRIKAVEERRLLIVDDEFARDIGEFKNLEELRNDIRKKLKAAAEIRVEQNLRNQVREKLAGMVDAKLPPKLVEKQKEHVKRISKALLGGEDTGNDDEKLKNIAETQLKEHLAIEEIIRKENITVTDEELEKVRAEIRASGRKGEEENSDDLRWRLEKKKTIDFLLSNAKIEDKGERLIMTPEEARLVEERESALRDKMGRSVKV